jgi:NAD(P)-dependent dehydrogenase (short-subunit alcohol dehydrogenase family)
MQRIKSAVTHFVLHVSPAHEAIPHHTETDIWTVVDTALLSVITRDADNPIVVGTTRALTAAHPWGTLGQVEDVGKAAVFLVSEDAQWVTGLPLVIGGGYTAQ